MSDIDDGPSLTIDAFCDGESISRAFYFELQRRNLGPKTYCPPGTRAVRITSKARRDWRDLMEELSRQEAGQLEHVRRQDQAVRAGKAAVQSEQHVSKRKLTKRV
jgi:hypothetical protein